MATPTPARETVRPRVTVVKSRKRGLAAADATYDDLARVARVSWSMAWKWMNDVRKSAECQRAFDLLTGKKQETPAA